MRVEMRDAEPLEVMPERGRKRACSVDKYRGARANRRDSDDEKAAGSGGLDASIAVRCEAGPAKLAYFCCGALSGLSLLGFGAPWFCWGDDGAPWFCCGAEAGFVVGVVGFCCSFVMM